MPAVLGANQKAVLHQEAASSHQLHMSRIKNNKSNTNNIVRLSAAKQFDEPSPQRAAAIERIMSTNTSS